MSWRCGSSARRLLCHAAYSPKDCCFRHISSTAKKQQSDERLRILFCGSEAFSAFSLRALSEYAQVPGSNIESIDVVTRKDKYVGRGLKRIQPPFIKAVAEELQLPVHQIDTFTGWNPPGYSQGSSPPSAINLIIAVSFGLLVPPRILRGAAYGGLNIHPSLLPQFKGAAPIHWTILHGLKTTGVSLQTLHESKFDEGVVLDRVLTPIEKPHTCTFYQLRNQLGPIGARLLVEGLREKRYVSQRPVLTASEPDHILHAPKIRKQHMAVNPQVHGSRQVLRMQRAFGSLWAYAQDLEGKTVRIRTDSIGDRNMLVLEDSAYLPQSLRPMTSSIPIGMPYGIVTGGKAPQHAGQAPLLMNTRDGPLAINALTVSGAATDFALASAAKGKLLKHHASLGSGSGETWDIYTFSAPLRGESGGLPAINPEDDGNATQEPY